MSPPEYVTRAEFARVEGKLDSLLEAWSEVRPLVLGQSGDRAELNQLRRDVDSSHEKHRGHYTQITDLKEQVRAVRDEVLRKVNEVDSHARQERDSIRDSIMARFDRVEKRDIKIGGMLIGAIAVIQLLAPALAPFFGHVLKAIGLGP